MIPTPVARSVDLTLVMVPTPHQYYGAATAYMAPSMGIAAEAMYHPMKFPPGMLTGSHKIAPSVESHGFCVVQAGHKLGPLIVHLEAVPAADDLLTPIQMLKSNFEIKFQNGEVLVQGTPMGSILPSLMDALVCTDVISVPVGKSPTTLINMVWHYTSIIDIIAGYVEIAINAIFEYIANRGNMSGTHRTASRGGPVSSYRLADRGTLMDPLRPKGGEMGLSALGSGLSSLGGAAVRGLGREFFGYRGPVGASVSTNAGVFAQGQAEVTRADDGSWTVGESASLPAGLAQGGRQDTWDANGQDTGGETTGRLGPATGSL